MTDEHQQRPAGRPLRDLGAFAVLLTARPLLVWYNRGERRDGLRLTPPTELRRQARRFPRDGSEFSEASMARTFAWVFVMLVFLAAYILTAFIRSWTGTWDHRAPVIIMTVSMALTMFAGGALMVSGARWSLAWWQDERLDHALAAAAPGERPRGWLVRLCTPSHGDLVFAGLWALFITPALYDLIVAHPA